MTYLTEAQRAKIRERLVSLRPEVALFALEMERKLQENDHKGGWSRCTKQYLSMRLTQEREELRRAVERGDPNDIRREAADVANFAMMLADVCDGLTYESSPKLLLEESESWRKVVLEESSPERDDTVPAGPPRP
jgi:NTP pyrophosphatase (non-canonical NTP hydrolase)